MQVMMLRIWGFDYCRAEYYGRRHCVHLGPFLIFWGQMTPEEIAAWEGHP